MGEKKRAVSRDGRGPIRRKPSRSKSRDRSRVGASPKRKEPPAGPAFLSACHELIDATAGWTTPPLSGDTPTLGLDLVRTLLNLVLFLAHVAGWKAVWDVQDAMLIPWPASIALGIAAHFARPAVDRWLGTEHLAATSWFSHLAHLDDLSWNSTTVYVRASMSFAWSFTTGLLLWRGLFTVYDQAAQPWQVWMAVSVVPCFVLGAFQLIAERRARQRTSGVVPKQD